MNSTQKMTTKHNCRSELKVLAIMFFWSKRAKRDWFGKHSHWFGQNWFRLYECHCLSRTEISARICRNSKKERNAQQTPPNISHKKERRDSDETFRCRLI